MFLDELDQTRMVKRFVQVFISLETFEQNRIGFYFGPRDFDGYRLIREQIGCPESGGGAAMRDHALNSVVTQLRAGLDGCPVVFVHLIHRFSHSK